ncbi:MAG: nickel-dependent hydrogenase large subunit [Burkholderiales bacterium]|nr:nickel-dependent hydrogenase large subunit [Burkholderiales bacterium]
MTQWDQLAGELRLVPGAPVPRNLLRRRPAGLRRVLQGQPAEAWPDLAAAVFSLCGHAHRGTARRAIAAARGQVAAPDAPARTALRWHTARDHVRRILLDWCTADAALREAAAQALACSPLPHGDDAAAALRALPAWLSTQLLGMPVAGWLAQAERGGEAWLRDWCETHEGPAAAFLRSTASTARRIVLPVQPLALHDDAPAQAALAQRLAAALEMDDDAAIAPLAAGRLETGAWTRHRDAARGPVHNAWMRFAFRLVDLARLAADEGSDWLCGGALTTGPGEGMAWTEMARGLLVHWVRLDGERVAHFRVLSPTDWNFHPEGALAQALPALDAHGARLLAAAFDPCVPAVLARSEEAAHA